MCSSDLRDATAKVMERLESLTAEVDGKPQLQGLIPGFLSNNARTSLAQLRASFFRLDLIVVNSKAVNAKQMLDEYTANKATADAEANNLERCMDLAKEELKKHV